MVQLTPVDHDPFAEAPSNKVRLEQVDYDPFAQGGKPNTGEVLAPAQGAFPAVPRAAVEPARDTTPASAPPLSDAPSQAPASEPNFLQESYGDLVKGTHSAKRGAMLTGWLLGMYDDVPNIAKHLAASEELARQYPSSVATQKANEELESLKDRGAGGLLPALGVYAKNPRFAWNTAVESLPSMLPSLVTTPVGAVAGSVLGPAGTSAGAWLGLGAGSAVADFGNSFEEYLRDKWKPRSDLDWQNVLVDPEKVREARDYAAKHAGMVGLFDALGGKVGGRVAMGVGGRIAEAGLGKTAQIAGGGAAGAGIDIAAGGAGEAAGQLAGSGAITDPGAVAGELAAGALTSGPTVAVEPALHALNGGKLGTPPKPEDVAGAGAAMQGGGVPLTQADFDAAKKELNTRVLQAVRDNNIPEDQIKWDHPAIAPIVQEAKDLQARWDAQQKTFQPAPEEVSGEIKAVGTDEAATSPAVESNLFVRDVQRPTEDEVRQHALDVATTVEEVQRPREGSVLADNLTNNLVGERSSQVELTLRTPSIEGDVTTGVSFDTLLGENDAPVAVMTRVDTPTVGDAKGEIVSNPSHAETAFRNALQWSVKQGYTRVAWNTGLEGATKIPQLARTFAKRLGGTWGEFTNNEQSFKYVDIPRVAVEALQRGLPMYSEVVGRDNVSLSIPNGATIDPKVAGALGQALQELVKKFKLGVDVGLTFHEGTQIQTFDPVSGQTIRKNNVLGFVLNQWHSKPEIHIAWGHHQNVEALWATITHEFGHIVEVTSYARAPAHVKTAIRAAYDAFRAKHGTSLSLKKLLLVRDNAVANRFNIRQVDDNSALPQSGPRREYWIGFEEWFAEQTARWATSSDKALTLVERFFQGLGRKIKTALLEAGKMFGYSYEANTAMQRWLDSFHADCPPFAEDINTVNDVKTTGENQREMGRDEKAVEAQPETVTPREAVKDLFNGRPPKEVKETLAYADKFNKIYKWMLGIHQVAQRNPHIKALQEYTETIAVAQLTKQQVMIRAQEVLKKWNRLGGKQSAALAALIDDVQNMVYLTPDEVKNKVTRFPTQQELEALVKKHGVSVEGLAVFREVAATFQEHLTRYEAVLRNEANKIRNAQERADRHDMITLQIRSLRMKPYFPAMRFGDYTVTIRNAAGQVIHFETFERRGQRDKAAEAIAKANGIPQDRMELGKIDRQARPLLGVPTQLLEMMAEKLTLSPAQRDALDQLKFEMSPAQSFRHRFQHKKRIAGYSQDFRRAYANYFFHGANHLMKTMYADRLRGLAKATREETKGVYDVTTRHEIVAYMNDHLENWLDPKSDWAAIRSVAFLWALAYSPAAAAQNLTQTLMTTYPFLAQQFGDVAAVRTLMKVGGDFTTWYKTGKLQNATEFELKALARGMKDGIINEAMAPELAGYAEGDTLGWGFGGNELQRGVQRFNEWGAKMFELAEQTNRRLVFRAALRLAKERPDAKYVKDMQGKHRLHYEQLRKEGWTEEEATAYVVARDATITTQFQYGREYAPRFMRGKLRSIFVFKTFIQNYMLFLANYPQARVRSMLVLGFLGGLMGVPGSDDLKEILQAIAWKMFGKDFNLEHEARRYLVQLLGEDENGRQVADIMLHGVARRGYGIPALMDMLGGTVGVDIPMPTFDRSAAISAGTILPVELGKLFGPPTQSQDAVISGQAQKASGAVFGAGFSIYKALTSTSLDWDDAKRWEKAVPRFIGSLSKAYRVGTEGRERSASGATVVKYDVRDTEQLAEVIGMAMGYTPYRQALQWNRIMASQEAVKLWDVKRQILMRQFDNAALGRDEKEIEKVKGAIQEFNSGLPTEARGKAITADALRESLQAKAKSRVLQEQGLSTRKGDIPILREVQSMFPDAQVTLRRVRGSAGE